jgi:hypothetical protein
MGSISGCLDISSGQGLRVARLHSPQLFMRECRRRTGPSFLLVGWGQSPSGDLQQTIHSQCRRQHFDSPTVVSGTLYGMPTNRRFPPPWSIEELGACLVVCDASGQKLGYFYYACCGSLDSIKRRLAVRVGPRKCFAPSHKRSSARR